MSDSGYTVSAERGYEQIGQSINWIYGTYAQMDKADSAKDFAERVESLVHELRDVAELIEVCRG